MRWKRLWPYGVERCRQFPELPSMFNFVALCNTGNQDSGRPLSFGVFAILRDWPLGILDIGFRLARLFLKLLNALSCAFDFR